MLLLLLLLLGLLFEVLSCSEKQSVSSNVRHALDNRPVYIRLKGLVKRLYLWLETYSLTQIPMVALCLFSSPVKDCMTGSLDKTRVLYAPVEEVGHEGRLLSACSILISLRD